MKLEIAQDIAGAQRIANMLVVKGGGGILAGGLAKDQNTSILVIYQGAKQALRILKGMGIAFNKVSQ